MPTPSDLSTATLLALRNEDIPPEFQASLVVLSAPMMQGFPRIARYVDFDARTYDSGRALNEGGTWAESERSLTRIAGALWGGDPADVRDVLSLDEKNFKRVMLAFEVFRGWKSYRDALAEAARIDLA